MIKATDEDMNMKVERSLAEKIVISELERLDPITVYLEDFGDGKGKIVIECYRESWSAYWGSMGQSLVDFFAKCDVGYLAGKLSSLRPSVFAPEKIKESLKKEVLEERRKSFIDKREARRRYRNIEDLHVPEEAAEMQYASGELLEALGEDWMHSLPMKSNPDYEYLCRIISTVQSALSDVSPKSDEARKVKTGMG